MDMAVSFEIRNAEYETEAVHPPASAQRLMATSVTTTYFLPLTYVVPGTPLLSRPDPSAAGASGGRPPAEGPSDERKINRAVQGCPPRVRDVSAQNAHGA